MATLTTSADLANDDAEDAAPPEPPTRQAGPYEIVAPIGAGGGGSVWLARDTRVEGPPRMVAVKLLHPEAAKAPALRRRFLREAEFAASIRHPNVVLVTEVGEAAGHPYLVMPFVEGTTVRQLLRRGPLPLAAVITIVSDALDGLTAAHDLAGPDGASLELVHRDVSPHNLLVAVDGTTKVTDFGIARPAFQASASTTRWAQGKVSYFSPEQGRGEPLDRRSDLFAMGVVLWECLVGRSLFRADDPFVTAHRIQTMRVPAPSTLRKGLTAEIDAVVAMALASDREARYANASQMRTALLGAAAAAEVSASRADVASLVAEELERQSPVQAISPPSASPSRSPSRSDEASPARGSRRNVVVASVLAIAVLGGVVSFALRTSSGDAKKATDALAAETSSAPSSSPVPTTSVLAVASEPASPPPAPADAADAAAKEAPSKRPKVTTPRVRSAQPAVRPSTTGEPRVPSPVNPF